MDSGADATAYFAELSRKLLDDPEERATFRKIAESAADAVPGCEWTGIILRRRRGRVETVATSFPLAEKVDAWQDELGQGPALAALETDDLQLVDDVRSDARWPDWAALAANAGVGSALSVPLSTESHALGALNLYADKPFAFDAESVERGRIFASHATTAIVAARLVSGLQTAVQSRHVIGAAQGILMQRYGMTLDASFEVLRRYSSHSNRKLRHVAQLVVEHRGLPDDHVDLAALPAVIEGDAAEE